MEYPSPKQTKMLLDLVKKLEEEPPKLFLIAFALSYQEYSIVEIKQANALALSLGKGVHLVPLLLLYMFSLFQDDGDFLKQDSWKHWKVFPGRSIPEKILSGAQPWKVANVVPESFEIKEIPVWQFFVHNDKAITWYVIPSAMFDDDYTNDDESPRTFCWIKEFTTRVTHGGGCHVGVMKAEAIGVSFEAIKRGGNWKDRFGRLEAHYLGKLPYPFARGIAGFKDKPFGLPKNSVPPPLDLQKMVFPWIEDYFSRGNLDWKIACDKEINE
ncbi:hypothetical protein [Parasitella parasitica]|uniref:Ndc10 domain-containing protein n=1 Tax=Parasitella parasitica TaxID=35722 RepID=A0A0B7N200_9FUNG|nr:hypothetical protein [Parasitella parasitica]